MREGGGMVDLPRADVPLIFAAPDRSLVRAPGTRRERDPNRRR